MPPRHLSAVAVPPGPEGVRALLAALPAALDGSGPALAPLPVVDGDPAWLAERREAVRAEDPGAPLESEDIAAVVTTSGSTGAPRGVLLPAPSLQRSAAVSLAAIGGPGRWVVAVPVDSVGGLMTLVRAIASGVEPLVWPGLGGASSFDAESFLPVAQRALAMRDADGARAYTSIVPTQLARLLADPESAQALAAFDHVLVGAAALPAGIRAAAELAGVRFSSTYGASETCGGVVYDGLPLPGVTVSVEPIPGTDPSDEGRLVIDAPWLAAGYRLRPDLTVAAFGPRGWRTEDLGTLAADGVVRVVGRLDDVVKVGGTKVSLPAVTDVLRAHPEVADAAVVAVPDASWGSRVIAYVVLSAGSHDDLRAHVSARLGRAAAPTEVVTLDTLPMLGSGKVDRAALQARAADPAE